MSSVTTGNPIVQELIPELFYLPEMLLNENKVTYSVGLGFVLKPGSVEL